MKTPGVFRFCNAALIMATLASVLVQGCFLVEETDTSTTRVSGTSYYDELPDCRSCHDYPQLSGSHSDHLFHTTSGDGPNGFITCMDCHYGSIRSVAAVNPVNGDTVQVPDLSHIDTTLDGRDFSAIQKFLSNWFGTHAPDTTELPKLLTASLHNNGHLDVVFAPADAYDPAVTASFNQKTGTCTACHGPGTGTEYRW